MKMKKIIGSFLWIYAAFSSVVGLAAPVETREWNYQVRESDFIPGHSAKMVREGVRIGHLRENSNPLPSGNTLDQLLEVGRTRMEQQGQTLTSERDRLFSSLRSLSPSSSTPEITSLALPSTPQSLQLEQTPVFHWENLIECSKKILPQLKELIAVENKLEQAQRRERSILALKVTQLRQVITQNRGDGQSFGRTGVACGKFLGAAGFATRNLIEDVKFLSTLISRGETEARFLLKAAVAAFHPQVSREASQLWQIYWKVLSVRAVFTTASLPNLEALQEEVRTGLETQLSRSQGISIQLTNFAQDTEAGFQFAEGILR
jgi:hypothetical protein